MVNTNDLSTEPPVLPTTPPVDSAHRTVVYSPETIRAYGAFIGTGVAGGDVISALQHLATMVHCDITGELREPHTHSVSGIKIGDTAR